MTEKVRRNALHRYAEDNKAQLERYGFRIDADTRTLYTSNRTIRIPEYLSRQDIHTLVNAQKRLTEESAKISHDIFKERMQNKLL